MPQPKIKSADKVAPRTSRLTALQHAFGRNVQAVREEKGLTQAQLAKLTGTSQKHISRIEAGTIGVRLETVAKFAQVLKKPPLDLLKPKRPVKR